MQAYRYIMACVGAGVTITDSHSPSPPPPPPTHTDYPGLLNLYDNVRLWFTIPHIFFGSGRHPARALEVLAFPRRTDTRCTLHVLPRSSPFSSNTLHQPTSWPRGRTIYSPHGICPFAHYARTLYVIFVAPLGLFIVLIYVLFSFFTDGLMTPPASPTKSRGTGNVHPCLTQAGASGVLFHLGRPIQNIRFQSNQDPRLVFSQPATDINATALHILLPFGIEITITNPSGIQVGDVFHQLQVELSKRPTAQELSTFASVMRGTSLPSTAVRRADLIATSPYFAGLTPYGNSWRLQIRQA